MDKTSNNGKAKFKRNSLAAISLAALGIVFGDIGTSPLYAVRECFHGKYGIPTTPENILGILSLMFWALIIVVSTKYLLFIFRADNHGEGGVLALTAQFMQDHQSKLKSKAILIGLGLFGACLLYGDGMITPAISVMSAIEGLKIVTPKFDSLVIPGTLIILTLLFIMQKNGTHRIGKLFGPIILIWFVSLAILGIRQILVHPEILKALSPVYAVSYLINSQMHGLTVLGAVFLVVTGAEALFADLGHFGTKPIRLVWFTLVLPSLMLNYFGQGALLLARPEEAYHPFYAMVPSWGVIPMLVLATVATIIASQAVITGVFSLTRQAIQLGFLPRMHIVHTSSSHFGQIYIPSINWLMMIATLSLVFGFQSSSHLAAAYGVAVTATMLISTILFYYITRVKWKWNIFSAGLLFVIFVVVDLAFLSANFSKILHGAWFPLVLGLILVVVMRTWKTGRKYLSDQLSRSVVPLEDFPDMIQNENIKRVKGYAVYLSGNPNQIPHSLMHSLGHMKTIHSNVIILNFSFKEIPRVPNLDKIELKKHGSGFYHVVAYYGFMETPSVPSILELLKGQGLEIPMMETSFFLGREKLILDDKKYFSRWRANLFSFLSRNSYDASTYFNIPENRVIEIGIRLNI